jgi:CRISPR-associated endonuclease/helicase Cas3
VVEVGLDITSQALHTELAPAASVIQRAGRCARYKGETGDVYVYRLPPNRHGKPDYAPYFKEQKATCEKTWSALKERSSDVFGFGSELEVVNKAHGQADQRMLDRLQAIRHYLVDRIADTIETQERGAARQLIRDVDSRTVIVHPDPASIDNPWAYEGFGIYKGTLFGAYETLVDLADDLGEDWAMMTAEAVREEESSRAPTVWKWLDVWDEEELKGALIVAVNPRLAHYSAETGFQLGVRSPSQGEGRGEGLWQSPPRERKGTRKSFPPYQRETFQEHVERMVRVYQYPFYDRTEDRQRLALSEELAYAGRRLEGKYGWTQGTLDRLARLIIALHDLGKLDERWQAWAHRWQKEVGALRGEDLAISDAYMAAHTDYDGQDEEEEGLNRKLRRMKPNHAVESAQAAEDLLWEQMKDEALTRAGLTAIARHHSAGARGRYSDFRAHPAAQAALAEVLEGLDPALVAWQFTEGSLTQKMIRPRRPEELLPYLLLVRALRLADQRSQMKEW